MIDLLAGWMIFLPGGVRCKRATGCTWEQGNGRRVEERPIFRFYVCQGRCRLPVQAGRSKISKQRLVRLVSLCQLATLIDISEHGLRR